MKSNPAKVSLIVSTKNSEGTIMACLESIKSQDYPAIEIIVVDNFSQDNTLSIAKQITDLAYSHGPERSYQRNFGVRKSTGKYVLIVDSDMELTNEAVSQCVKKMQSDPNTKAIVIPEVSFGIGFWAQCKALERSFYAGVDWIEAARFFPKELYLQLGGYDEQMYSGEDWDLSQRAAKFGPLGRIEATIRHNEGRLKLSHSLKKKFYYAGNLRHYRGHKEHTRESAKQFGVFNRYGVYFRNWRKLIQDPILSVGMLYMKTCEMAAGALGYMNSLRSRSK